MAGTKYGNYITPLSFKDYGPGGYRQGTVITSEMLGLDVHLEYGTYFTAGKTGREPGKAEVSEYDRTVLWMGTDTYDLGELGAEVELYLGEEREKHLIATSSAAFIPKGMQYQAVCTRMEERFINLSVWLGPTPDVKTVTPGETSVEPLGWEAKYGKNVMHLTFERKGLSHYGPQNRDDAGGYISNMDGTGGFEYNMSYEAINRAPYRFGPVPNRPHVHQYDEFLIFMGADCEDLSDLGGEAELCMGKEMERHVISEPTVAVMPKGVPHCPLAITRADIPFIFIVVRPFGHVGIENTKRLP